MTNTNLALYRRDDVFHLFTSPEWMSRRSLHPASFHPYLEDLQHLASAYETGALEDLPKRLVLSYLEHRVRSVYSDVPLALLDTMWLCHEDGLGQIYPLALSLPTLKQRLEHLHRLAVLLILEGKTAEATEVVRAAISFYLTTDEADYSHEHERRGAGADLARMYADLGQVDYDLLDSLYQQHQWLDASIKDQERRHRRPFDQLVRRSIYRLLDTDTESAESRQWDPQSVPSYFTSEVLKSVLTRLGTAGASQEAAKLISHSTGKWLLGRKQYLPNDLEIFFTTGLITGRHFEDAEHSLSALGYEQKEVVELWCDLLEKLYDAGQEGRLKAVLAKIEHTPVWAAVESSSYHRRDILAGKTSRPASPQAIQQSEWRSWILAQFTANLWRHEYELAGAYLALWSTSEEIEQKHLMVQSGELSRWRRRQKFDSLSDSLAVTTFGSFSDPAGASLWLAMLGKFDVLETLLSTGIHKYWPPRWTAPDITPDLIGLSQANTVGELRRWLSSTSGQDASDAGCAYLAFRHAKQGQLTEAEKVLEVIPEAHGESRERVGLALAQGLALGVGIEQARRYVKERCRIMDRRDFAGDIWTAARALIGFDRVDDALPLLREDTYEHPGMRQTWVDLAGALRKRYGAEQAAELLAPISFKFAAEIANRYVVLDDAYTRSFLGALMKRIPLPTWGVGLGTGWPGVAIQEAEIRALSKRVGKLVDRQALGRLVIDRDLFLDPLHQITSGFGARSGSLSEILVVIVPGRIWFGGALSSDWGTLPREEVEAELRAIKVLENELPASEFPMQSAFYARLGLCLTTALPYRDLLISLIRDLAATLCEYPEDLWHAIFAVPPALASIGEIHEALDLAHHVSQRKPRDAKGPYESADAPSAHVVYAYCQAQIALAAPPSAERDALLAEVLQDCLDTNLLMQMLVYYAQQGDAAADIVLRAIVAGTSTYRFPVDDEPETTSAMTKQDDLDEWLTQIGSAPPADRIRDLQEDDNIDPAGIDIPLTDEDGRADPEPDWSELLQNCFRLLVAGRSDIVRELLETWQAPDELVSEVVALSPTSLDGMLGIFSSIGSPQALNPDTWPHNVLLAEAERVSDVEDLFKLVAAVEEVVQTDSITAAYQAIIDRLPLSVMPLVLSAITDEDRELGDFQRAILMASSMPRAVRDAASAEIIAELMSNSLQCLDNYFAQKQSWGRVLLWGGLRPGGLLARRRGAETTPRLAYCRGLAVLARCLQQAGLGQDYERVLAVLLNHLYVVLRKTEQWQDSGLSSGVREVLIELGNDELLETVVKEFREAGDRWANDSQSAT